MKNQNVGIPKFINEDEGAKWWASAEGREFLKRQSAQRTLKSKRDRHSWNWVSDASEDAGAQRAEVHQATSSSRSGPHSDIHPRQVSRIQRRHGSRGAGIRHRHQRTHTQPLLPGAFHHGVAGGIHRNLHVGGA
jgi:hypothetical protein